VGLTPPEPAGGPRPDEPPDRRAELRELYRTQMLSSIGGWSGTVISALPTVVFVAVNAFAGLRPAVIAAVASAAAAALYRLARKESLQQAGGSLIGVVIAALIVARTGQARDYFLVGILTSFAYAAVFAGSIAIRRPLVGVIWEFLDPSATGGRPWRRVRPLLRAYDKATAAALLLFGSRAVVQTSLFQRNATGWLAAARLAMGYPLYILTLGYIFWACRRARRALGAVPGEALDEGPGAAPGGEAG
jgi:hypothetical protein